MLLHEEFGVLALKTMSFYQIGYQNDKRVKILYFLLHMWVLMYMFYRLPKFQAFLFVSCIIKGVKFVFHQFYPKKRSPRVKPSKILVTNENNYSMIVRTSKSDKQKKDNIANISTERQIPT